MINKNKCSVKYCRNEYSLTYLGVKLCSKCWEKKAVDNFKYQNDKFKDDEI